MTRPKLMSHHIFVIGCFQKFHFKFQTHILNVTKQYSAYANEELNTMAFLSRKSMVLAC